MKKLIFILALMIGLDLSAQKPLSPSPLSVEPQTIYALTEEMPSFPGGQGEMYKFIQNNITFPERCKNDTSFTVCKVYMRFIVNENGKTESPQVIKTCTGYPELEAEATRVISIMPQWSPGKQNGVKVKVYYTLPFVFKKKK